MVPPEVTASRCAPGRPSMVPAFRSQTMRGPQFGEFVRGVAAGQQVQGGVKGGAGERGERALTAHGGEPFLHVDGAQRRGRHGLLGQDVQRVGRDGERLDLAGQHPLHRDGRVQQVRPVLGEQDALGDLADLVPGTAHPLQAAGHRRRGLHLHHQVHGTHVDAQFQAGGGHHAAQPAGLQVVLDQGPLVLGHRAVVGPGQHRVGAGRCCRPAPSCAPACRRRRRRPATRHRRPAPRRCGSKSGAPAPNSPGRRRRPSSWRSA